MDDFIEIVPIIIGVTGHRDIPAEDIPKLRSVLRQELLNISKNYSNSPIQLINCLAEGGDRIAAQIALELGWRLGVILPAPDYIYEQDFKTEGSQYEFRALLKQAAWIEQLPVQEDGQCDYLGAGIRVLQCSQLLLALWNGAQNDLPGGTGDIVKTCLTGIPQFIGHASEINLPDTHLVIQIVTRRVNACNELSQKQVGQVCLHQPTLNGIKSNEEAERWKNIFRCIDQFNFDAQSFKQKYPEKITASSFLLGEKLDISPHNNAAHLFAIADAMSSHAQKIRERDFIALLLMSMLAILMEQLYSGPLDKPIFLLASIILGVFAYTLYKKDGSLHREVRYLDYRALAEACRVQHFWNFTGILIPVADKFLREQRDELEWIRQALRTTQLTIKNPQSTPISKLDRFESVKKNWIEGQCHYFIGDGDHKKGGYSKNETRHAFYSKIAAGFFYAGIVVVISTLAINVLFPNTEKSIQLLSFLYSVLFSLAGLSKVYLETKAFDEHSRSFLRSGLLMKRTLDYLNCAIKNKEINKAELIIYDIGCAALNENSDWLLMHRQRPVRVPL